MKFLRIIAYINLAGCIPILFGLLDGDAAFHLLVGYIILEKGYNR